MGKDALLVLAPCNHHHSKSGLVWLISNLTSSLNLLADEKLNTALLCSHKFLVELCTVNNISSVTFFTLAMLMGNSTLNCSLTIVWRNTCENMSKNTLEKS